MRSNIFTYLSFPQDLESTYFLYYTRFVGRNVLLGGLPLYQAMGVAVVLCRARVVGLYETGRED